MAYPRILLRCLCWETIRHVQLEMLFVPDFFEHWTDTLEMTVFAVMPRLFPSYISASSSKCFATVPNASLRTYLTAN